MAGDGGQRWSRQVTETSAALELEPGVFTWDDPVMIASSLMRSAEASTRRKSPPFRSAMSMLNFYINRAGRKLPGERREILEKAKTHLRELYGRPAARADRSESHRSKPERTGRDVPGSTREIGPSFQEERR